MIKVVSTLPPIVKATMYVFVFTFFSLRSHLAVSFNDNSSLRVAQFHNARWNDDHERFSLHPCRFAREDRARHTMDRQPRWDEMVECPDPAIPVSPSTWADPPGLLILRARIHVYATSYASAANGQSISEWWPHAGS